MPRFVRHPPIAPISCQQVVELVTAYLERALDAPTTRRVDAHLARCEPCQVYVDQIRATVGRLASTELPSLPDEVCAGLLEAFRDWRTRESP